MSQRLLFCLFPTGILSDRALPANALRIWLALAARQAADDSASMPLHDLERQCGLTRPTVTKCLQHLARRGYLKYWRMPGGVLRYNVGVDVDVVE